MMAANCVRVTTRTI